MAADPQTQKNAQRLARALGIIACLLAWTAAAIRYSTDGSVQVSLIAAGLFFAVFGFIIKPTPPKDR